MKKTVLLFFAILITLIACKSEQTPTDAFTSASVKNYYTDSMPTHDTLLDMLKNRTGAVSVATVNSDGTPNAAVVIPGIADENHLMFGLADNQTRLNLLERKRAVLTFYIYRPDAEERSERNGGFRLKLETVEDPDYQKALMEKSGAQEGAVFMKITEVLPIG